MTAAVQFGFAISPVCSLTSSPLISGITSGTAGSIRKADELSMTTAPAARAMGANLREISPPALKNARSISAKLLSSSASIEIVSPRKPIFFPAEFAEANARIESTGKVRFSNTPNSSRPTAPVAPTIATRYRLLTVRTIVLVSSGEKAATLHSCLDRPTAS